MFNTSFICQIMLALFAWWFQIELNKNVLNILAYNKYIIIISTSIFLVKYYFIVFVLD